MKKISHEAASIYRSLGCVIVSENDTTSFELYSVFTFHTKKNNCWTIDGLMS